MAGWPMRFCWYTAALSCLHNQPHVSQMVHCTASPPHLCHLSHQTHLCRTESPHATAPRPQPYHARTLLPALIDHCPQAYDCPELFQVADQALCSDPLLKLAVLMAPLRWLLLFDGARPGGGCVRLAAAGGMR